MYIVHNIVRHLVVVRLTARVFNLVHRSPRREYPLRFSAYIVFEKFRSGLTEVCYRFFTCGASTGPFRSVFRRFVCRSLGLRFGRFAFSTPCCLCCRDLCIRGPCNAMPGSGTCIAFHLKNIFSGSPLPSLRFRVRLPLRSLPSRLVNTVTATWSGSPLAAHVLRFKEQRLVTGRLRVPSGCCTA